MKIINEIYVIVILVMIVFVNNFFSLNRKLFVMLIGMKKINKWMIFNVNVVIGWCMVFNDELVRMIMFCML